MAVFRVERNKCYTVMSNHHLRNKELTLKAKGSLSQMFSLHENWDYTLAGLSHINREKIDIIREAIKELERAGHIVRSRTRDEKGRLRGADYVIYEQPPASDLPMLENSTQLNKEILDKELKNKDGMIIDSIPILSPNPSPCIDGEAEPERKGKNYHAIYSNNKADSKALAESNQTAAYVS